MDENQHRINQIRCRNCGSTVSREVTECDYCFTPLRITTLKSISSMQTSIAQKLVRSYSSDEGDKDTKISLALLFLRLSQYEKACSFASEAIDDDASNDEAYFVSALAKLGGKKPFLCQRTTIDAALQNLEAAFELNESAIYKIFSAIIKYDYFFRKGFRISPDYAEELRAAHSIGVGSGDLQELLKLIRFDAPADFFVN